MYGAIESRSTIKYHDGDRRMAYLKHIADWNTKGAFSIGQSKFDEMLNLQT